MFSASQLSDDQKSALKQWAAEGASIADLQKGLKDEFDVGITYMDARFLVLDLGIEIVDENAKAAEETKAAESAKTMPALESEVVEPEVQSPGLGGQVRVTMDQVTIPGAMVSGKVVFSDGEKAIWMIDEYGRPGLETDTPGYRPVKEDIESFQKQLSDIVRKSGM
ncbi:MAG: hypothetical protein ACQKBU_12060 [Verrucomicrobiales bacterium]